MKLLLKVWHFYRNHPCIK